MAGMALNYSKWDNIEISDDEADCHPNIDKASWFRMKHRSRVEREDQEENDKGYMLQENAKDKKREDEVVRVLAEIKAGGDAAEFEDPAALSAELVELRSRVQERLEKMDFAEKNKKWNVDNMCTDGESKTIISGKGEDASSLQGSLMSRDPKKGAKKAGPASEKEAVLSYAKYVEEHEVAIEQFCATDDFDQCRDQLHGNGSLLLHEHCQSYILLSCLEDEMNGFHSKMKLTARNSQILSHITELGSSLGRHPRDVVIPFFRRISEKEYRKGFDESVSGFVSRIQNRAVEKRKEMDAEALANPEYVELGEEERLGPGGLDPVVIFEALPQSMQDAFEAKDMQALQVALEAMPLEEAKTHMENCERSGLWVPGK
ncbi:hypothetical protein M885DRAFT_528266 [Pelagophyceae sp. CCMP2097]|nr:hypothetical protein M885DRAFT_528266 [Pelagophyceae sp. CCMP2097]